MNSLFNLFKLDNSNSKRKSSFSNNDLRKGIEGENISKKKTQINDKSYISNNSLNTSLIHSNLKNQIFEWNKEGSSEEFENFLTKLIEQKMFDKINWRPLSFNLSSFLDESENIKLAFLEKVLHIIDDYHIKIGNNIQTLKKIEDESCNISSNISKFRDIQMNFRYEIFDLKSKNQELNETIKMINEENVQIKTELSKNIKEIEFLQSSNITLKENLMKMEKKHARHLEKLMQNLLMSSSELNDIRKVLIREKLKNNQLSISNRENLTIINELQEKNKALSMKNDELVVNSSNLFSKGKLSIPLEIIQKNEIEVKEVIIKNESSNNNLINSLSIPKKNQIDDIFSSKLKYNVSIQNFLENKDLLSLLKLSKNFYKIVSLNESFWKSIISNITRDANLKFKKITLLKTIEENSMLKYDLENDIKENKEKMNELNSYIDLFLIKDQKLSLLDNSIIEEAKYFIITGKIDPPPQLANKNSGSILSSFGLGSFFANSQKEEKNNEKESKLFFNMDYDSNLSSDNINDLLKKAIKGFSGNPDKTNNWMKRLLILFGKLFSSLTKLFDDSRKVEVIKNFLSKKFDNVKSQNKELKIKVSNYEKDILILKEFIDTSSKRLKDSATEKDNLNQNIISLHQEIKVLFYLGIKSNYF